MLLNQSFRKRVLESATNHKYRKFEFVLQKKFNKAIIKVLNLKVVSNSIKNILEKLLLKNSFNSACLRRKMRLAMLKIWFLCLLFTKVKLKLSKNLKLTGHKLQLQ